MKRKLMIDGNAVYEIDEECMLEKRRKGKKNEAINTGEDKKKDRDYTKRDME